MPVTLWWRSASSILVRNLTGNVFPWKTPSNHGNIKREINLLNLVVNPPLQAIDILWKRRFTRSLTGSQDELNLSVVFVLWLCTSNTMGSGTLLRFVRKKICVYFQPWCNFVESTPLFSNFNVVNNQVSRKFQVENSFLWRIIGRLFGKYQSRLD